MKHGKEYRQSIQQQIVDLLNRSHLGGHERATLEKLDFGTGQRRVQIIGQPFGVCLDTLSADLLDAYDAEYERVAHLYEQRKPVIDAYDKWLTFWNDFVAFTVRASLCSHPSSSPRCRKPRPIPVASACVATTPKPKVASARSSFANSRRSNRNSSTCSPNTTRTHFSSTTRPFAKNSTKLTTKCPPPLCPPRPKPSPSLRNAPHSRPFALERLSPPYVPPLPQLPIVFPLL